MLTLTASSLMLNKRFLLITSTNLSCNPRCLKEVKLLKEMGASVTVVAFNLHNWTTKTEIEIKHELPEVNFVYLETTKKDFFRWVFSSAMEKAARLLLPVFPSSSFIAAMALSKRSWLLLNWCKQTRLAPDMIIAHNPPAFYPAYLLAKRRSVPFALDIEDYHPGEGANAVLKKAVAYLMCRLLPLASYNSFASPLIKQHAEKLVGNGVASSGIVVNNVFSRSEFEQSFQMQEKEKLQLVWFSQFIDYGRGLENILPLLDHRKDELELTLIGSLRQSFFTNEIRGRSYIKTLGSMPQKQLHVQLAKYDVGLAVENAESDLNRDICLTNKIWAYYQAGLYILASDTTAQKQFINLHTGHGLFVNFSAATAINTIDNLVSTKKEIRNERANRLSAATGITWESESSMLINQWNAVLA